MAIIKLYNDLGGLEGSAESFTESQLRSAFQWADSELSLADEPSTKTFYERYNSIIYELFDFILNRDPSDGTYSLSSYALQLCRLLKDTLFHEIKSTRLVTLFRLMDEQLDNSERFIGWANEELDATIHSINGQIEQAEMNIRHEVRQLQGYSGQSNEDYEAHLRNTENKLRDLYKQTQQLLDAFTSTAGIEYKLKFLKNTFSDDEILQKLADKSLLFIRESHKKLRSQRALLDRAQPRVQALFKNLDAARFDRLSGQFLTYLLNPDRNVTPASGHPELPPDVPAKWLLSSPLKLKYLPNRTSRIFPPVRIPAPQVAPDPEAEKEFLLQAEVQLRLQQRTDFWLTELIQQVQQNKSVAFEPFATAIIQNEAPDEVYSILAFLLGRVLNETVPRQGWSVHSHTQEPPLVINHTSFALWPLHFSHQ
ncbi:hypothetical protein [Fibrisoma limi]|nr:hypothetical protein [Fibrisoma limi]